MPDAGCRVAPVQGRRIPGAAWDFRGRTVVQNSPPHTRCCRRAATRRFRTITWKPETLSASFHGRDLFAPVAAMLATGAPVPGSETELCAGGQPEWPDDLAEIVYTDHFGNAMTGLRASTLPAGAVLRAGGHDFRPAHTFSDVPLGEGFWYENANGLAEFAVNGGRADALGLRIGTPVTL